MCFRQAISLGLHTIQRGKILSESLRKWFSTSNSFPDSEHIERRQELHGYQKLCNQHGNYTVIASAAHLTGDQTACITHADGAIRQILAKHAYMRSRISVRRESIREGETKGEQHVLETYSMAAFNQSSDLTCFFSVHYAENSESWKMRIQDGAARNLHLYDALNPYRSIVFPLIRYELIIDPRSEHNEGKSMFHLVVYTNHAIGDTRATHVFLHDFLTSVTQPNRKLVPNAQSVPPPVIIPKGYGLILYYYHLYKDLIKMFWSFRKRSQTPFQIPLMHPKIVFNSTQPARQIRTTFTSSTPKALATMKILCKQQNVTMHGPLLACLLLTLHHLFPIRCESKDEDTIELARTDVTYDLRAYLTDQQVTRDTIGLLSGSGEVEVGRVPLSTPFWTLAHSCFNKTKEGMTSKMVLRNHHCLEKLISSPRLFRHSIVKNNGLLAEIDFGNMGSYMYNKSYGNNDQIVLLGIHGTDMSCIYREAFLMAIVTVNEFNVSLLHTLERDEDAADVMQVYRCLLENIDAFASPSTTVRDVLQFLGER